MPSGIDAPNLARSIPIEKILAGWSAGFLYQNGERVRPEQGSTPTRIVLPGYEGNIEHQIGTLPASKSVPTPAYTKDESGEVHGHFSPMVRR